MTKKKDDSNLLDFFMEDAIFFSFWAFSNPSFYPREKYFGISEITPFHTWEYGRVFDFLVQRMKMADIPFPTIGYFSDTPSEELKPLHNEKMQGKDPVKKEAAVKFLNNDFGAKEVKALAPLVHKIYQWLYFMPKFSKSDVQKLVNQSDEYIQKFLNSELFVYDRNYLTFERQKQFFIGKIRNMAAFEKYGENFVISSVDDEGDGKDAGAKDGFLFIHTLYALQKLGYVTVLRLWCERDNVYNKHKYFANIVANNTLIDEVTNSFRKENPATIFEGYDEKHNLLKFAGKEVELSKKNKETDAVLLIKTLKKEPERYWFNDELFEDWGYQPEDETAKNKAYFAARKINEAVKMKTGIDDFIDHNTSKFRINPKYLKS